MSVQQIVTTVQLHVAANNAHQFICLDRILVRAQNPVSGASFFDHVHEGLELGAEWVVLRFRQRRVSYPPLRYIFLPL